MKYLIISDLHLCDSSGEDIFSHNIFEKWAREANLIKWITEINPDKLVLNGDIYDRWRVSWLKSRISHYKLINFFTKRNTVWLDGNHDASIIRKNKLEIKLSNGKKVIVAHGYQNDPNMLNPFARLGVWFFGQIERIIPFIDNLGQMVVSADIEKHTLEYALELQKKYDYVVLGHTHSLKNIGNYFNTGSCANGQLQGVLIDTDKNTINLKEK